MRILHITGSLARGGTETFIMNAFREIRQKGVIFDFLLFSDSKEGYYNEAISLGAVIYKLPQRRDGLFKYHRELNKFFRTYSANYDVVHYSSCTLTTIAPLFYAMKYGIKTRIIHGHSSSYVGFHNFILHSLNKFLIPYLATNYIACSSEASKFFYSRTKSYKKSIILKNGIKVEDFLYDSIERERVRSILNIEDTAFVIGHVGRFVSVKNHSFLLDIFEKILENTDAYLLLLGTGELMQKIQSKTLAMGLTEKVLFLGMQENVDSFLNAMDCIVFPSLYEGLPFSLVEAQASGLKIVASTTVSTETNITGEVLFVDLEKSADEWANIVINTMGSPRYKKHKLISDAGFSITKTVEVLCDIYNV